MCRFFSFLFSSSFFWVSSLLSHNVYRWILHKSLRCLKIMQKKTPDQRSSAPKHNERMHKPFIKSVFSSINRMPFLLFMELIYWRSDLCEVCRITHIQFCSKRWHYWSKGRNCKPLQMHVCDELWLHKLKPLWFWWFFFFFQWSMFVCTGGEIRYLLFEINIANSSRRRTCHVVLYRRVCGLSQHIET